MPARLVVTAFMSSDCPLGGGTLPQFLEHEPTQVSVGRRVQPFDAHLGGETISVVGEWVRLHLVYNRGAAFGLHLGPYSRWIFLVIAVLAVVILYRMSVSSPPGDRFRQLALGLVAGGAVGNLIDRIRSDQGVVDFLDVGIGALRWPTFNVADIGVTCGAVLLAILLWKRGGDFPPPSSTAEDSWGVIPSLSWR